MRWWVSVLLLGLWACGGEDDDSSPPNPAPVVEPEPQPAPQPDPQPEGAMDCAPDLTWDNFAEGFVRSFCRGCHSSALGAADRYGAPPGIDFDDRDAVLQHAERMAARATGEGADMPPGGGPTTAERTMFGAWLACQE